VLLRLDEALLAMRRLAAKPPMSGLPQAPGRPADLSRFMACGAVAKLAGAGEPVTVKDVAALLQLDHSSASRMVSDAEGEGLLARRPHPTDRRSTDLVLTEAGQGAAIEFQETRLAIAAQLLREWSTQDVETFAELLQRFVSEVGDACRPTR
jgi:DNA-binding MarR family transcriptional regulator